MIKMNHLTDKLVGSEDERAVSPVIGVILMVAITVILAAVIAAFVLDIGPGDTEPTAVVDIDGDGTEEVSVELISVGQGDGIAVVPNDDDIEDVDDVNIGDGDEFIASQTVTGASISLDGDSDDFDSDLDDETLQFTVIAYDGEDPEELADDLEFEDGDEGDQVIDQLNDEGSVNIVIEEDFEIETSD